MILRQREAELQTVGQKFHRGDVVEATELSLRKIRLEFMTLTFDHDMTLLYVPKHFMPVILPLKL